MAEVRNTVAEAVRIGRLNEPGSRQPEDLLRGLGLLRDGVLFRAAAVLFGNSERLEFELPQCLLRVARFRGIDRSEFLDNRQFNGNAFVLLSHAERFLRDTLPIASRFESGRIQRIDEPLYPPLATREFRSGERPVPPGLCAGRLATSAGLPRPEIEERGDCVTVCFRHRQVVPSRRSGLDLIERQEAILALLDRADDGLALREIRAQLALQASERQVKRALAALRNRGLAVSTGRGPAARWRRTPESFEDE